MISIFTYGFEISKNNFKKNKIEFKSLSSYEILLKQALITNYINEKEFKVLLNWRENPEKWNNKI